MRTSSWFAALGLAATLAAPAAFLGAQLDEDRAVDAFITEAGLEATPVTRATAWRVSDAVRAAFNVDEPTFSRLDMADRPFLRNDTAFLLDAREGLCGEGTRVLVNVLGRLGFDATRISLYDRTLSAAHTLVSVEIGGAEFLVDSINSPPSVNGFLRSRDVSAASFPIAAYTADITARRETLAAIDAGALADGGEAAFFERYLFPSYEGLPWTKLANAAGARVQILNFDRPPRVLSLLAEKPHALMALASFCCGLFLWSILVGGVYLVRRRRVLPRPRPATAR